MVYSLGLARAIFITSAYMRYSVEAAPCAPQAAGCSLLQAGRCAINGVEACGRSKPLCVVTRLQYHRLPIMDIRHDLIRFARDDGNGRNIISRLVLPHAPDARQCKGFSSRNGYLIFGIVLLMQPLPLKEAVSRHNTTPLLKGGFPEARLENAVRPRIEGKALGKGEAPIHQLNAAITFVVCEHDWLKTAGVRSSPAEKLRSSRLTLT